MTKIKQTKARIRSNKKKANKEEYETFINKKKEPKYPRNSY